jgi:hypothetical protein
MDVDILTFKKDWSELLPRHMPMGMPDPRKGGEYDQELGACFIGLRALVQLRLAGAGTLNPNSSRRW